MKYEELELAIIFFDAVDVITESQDPTGEDFDTPPM